ncbi:gliding motility-associated C-terminal domain-containing protein, partial [bacterium]|nr:gliding motility-associated C-terminal domain-containing protein [bacterium]
KNPTVRLNESGLFDIRVVMTTDSMCVDTVESSYSDHILVLDQPLSSFALSDSRIDMFEPYVQVTDSSEESNRIEFFLNGDFLSENRSIDLTLPDTGNYLIQQFAYNESGCMDSAFKTLRVLPDFLVFAPSSFTPNEDGLNDVWKPNVFVSTYYSLSIRDRWGHLVSQSDNPEIGWNGLNQKQSKESPIGLYYYQMKIADHEGQLHNYAGTITLYR